MEVDARRTSKLRRGVLASNWLYNGDGSYAPASLYTEAADGVHLLGLSLPAEPWRGDP